MDTLQRKLRLKPILPPELSGSQKSPTEAASSRSGDVVNPVAATMLSLANTSSLTMALTYLSAIMVAELVTALVHPLWGMLLHLTVLAFLLVHGSFPIDRVQRALLVSLAIAPLIRVVSLGLPLAQFGQLWGYAVAAIPLGVAAFIIMRSTDLSSERVALRLPPPRFRMATVQVALSGVVLGWVEFIILRPEPIVTPFTIQSVLVASIVLVLATGVLEEVVFRGILQETTIDAIGVWPGIIFTSVLFGVLHIGHLSVVDVIFVSVVALYFAIVVHRTRSLVGVSIAHGLTNVMLFVIFPLVPIVPL